MEERKFAFEPIRLFMCLAHITHGDWKDLINLDRLKWTQKDIGNKLCRCRCPQEHCSFICIWKPVAVIIFEDFVKSYRRWISPLVWIIRRDVLLANRIFQLLA